MLRPLVAGIRLNSELKWIFLTVLSGALARSMLVAFTAIWASQVLALKPSGLAVIFGLAGLFATGAGILFGWLCDRKDGLLSLRLAWCLQASTFFLFAISHFLPLSICLSLIVVSSSLASACAISSQYVTSTTIKSGGFLEGFSQIRLAQNIGYGMGPIIGSIAVLYSWSLVFLIVFVFGIFALFFSFKCNATGTGHATAKSQTNTGFVNTINYFPARTSMLLLFIASVFTMSIYACYTVVLPVVLVQNLSYEPYMWGLLAAANPIIIVIFQLQTTNWLRGFSSLKLLSFASLLFGVPYFLLSIYDSIFSLILVIVTVSFGEILWAPASQLFITEFFPAKSRGVVFGAFGATLPAGLAIGPVVGFSTLEVTSASVTFVIFACLSLVSSALISASSKLTGMKPDMG